MPLTRYLLWMLLIPLLFMLPGCQGKEQVKPIVTTTVAPLQAQVPVNGKQPFAALVKGCDDQHVRWGVAESNGGDIDPDTGIYAAPERPGTFHITATPVGCPQGGVTVPVKVVTYLQISPDCVTVSIGQHVPFEARLVGCDEAPNLVWAIQEGDCGGTIDSRTGLYCAPKDHTGTFHVIATTLDISPQQTVGATVHVVDGNIAVTVE